MALVLILSCLAAQAVHAQRYPGRGGDHGSSSKRDSDSRPAPGGRMQEPFAALERELPSLTVDLRINAAQVEAWSLVQRDVRDLAELDRVRKRHFEALYAMLDEGQRRMLDRRIVQSQTDPLGNESAAPRR